MGRRKKNIAKKQIESIMKETTNPAIIEDVTNSDVEFGNEKLKSGPLRETLIKKSVDGKTWSGMRDFE
ncbi:hypothetical protein [Bacillus solitudinis]|uniref:hypothetical protein n=1 Tax=Bacillus solitudinis TaxID=2014074 RepID=UPI000C248CED|nr:hypothetical protein [Bacillus solitudinis]